jgi:glycosidase
LDRIKPLFWLGETQDIQYMCVFDCCYTWDWMGWTQKYCNHEADLGKLKGILQHYENDYPPSSFRMFFTTNHDENTWNGTEYEKYGEAAKLLAVFSCTYDGLPLIYSGQEIPNRKRLKFFDKDPISWGEKPALQDFYKTLLQLRSRNPALEAGENARPRFMDVSANDRVLAFVRGNKEKKLIVILNFSAYAVDITLTGLEWQGEFTNIFTGKKTTLEPGISVGIEGWGYLVLEGE